MLKQKNKKWLLFLGDILILSFSLWLTLFFRYLKVPSFDIFSEHFFSFLLIFLIGIIIFFIAGLYEYRILIFRIRVVSLVFQTQLINCIFAILFFYLIPFFQITPKTILFIYLIISSVALVLWRIFFVKLFRVLPNERILIVGEGGDVDSLFFKMSNSFKNQDKNIFYLDTLKIDNESQLISIFNEIKPRLVLIDWDNQKVKNNLSYLYEYLSKNVVFVDIVKSYEDIFGMIPLSLVDNSWFLRNISNSHSFFYDRIKRLIDLTAGIFLFLPTLLLTPFVYLLIYFDDRGPLFIKQIRVGQNGKEIVFFKFRTMKQSDSGRWIEKGDNRHTRVGPFLRKTRIDELPQILNLIKGDLSLIGPRPDILGLGISLLEQIPYYNMRYIIKPGLSGWAQIQQKPPQNIEETKERLAYDLFYVKNRSLIFDLSIILRTIKTLISRTGM